MLTSAPNDYWNAVTCSADGQKLAAISGGATGRIYTSSNSGATWKATTAPTNDWIAVASSSDGTKLVAAVNHGLIYASPDRGESWAVSPATNADWQTAACSADGAKLFAAETNTTSFYGLIHASTNSGASWYATSAPGFPWLSIVSSSDGRRVAALGHDFRKAHPEIYVSGDCGDSWNAVADETSWPGFYGPLDIASSSDGNSLIVGTLVSVGISTNSGLSWDPDSLNKGVAAVATSADGTTVVAASSDGYMGTIYLSTNSGTTWTATGAPVTGWKGVCSSADGRKLVACVLGGGIYTLQPAPGPRLLTKWSEGTLLISWIVPSTRFILQESSDLIGASWSDVAEAPTLNYTNLHYELTVPAALGARFYRLSSAQ